jgi:hypothetical protein
MSRSPLGIIMCNYDVKGYRGRHHLCLYRSTHRGPSSTSQQFISPVTERLCQNASSSRRGATKALSPRGWDTSHFSMVRNEDEQSFASLTLTELLHPETADFGITRRHGGESPWETVYYEAVAGPVDYDNMPIATSVVAIDEDEDLEAANPQQPQDMSSPHRSTSSHREQSNVQQPFPKVQPWRQSNLIDLILGFALSLTAFILTIKLELTAIIIYTIAAGFHHLAEEIFHHPAGMLGRSICMVICSVLMVVDPILLTVSLLVTELIGGLALLLCSLSGGPKSGQLWHQ